METTTRIPDWLTCLPEDDPVPRYPRTKDEREVERIAFESVFERVIEGLEAGETPSKTIRSDPRSIDIGRFMGWVRRDPVKLKRFEEAKENGMLILEDRLMEIAEGAESMEDVQRSKFRADTIKWVMQSWARKRYGNDNSVQSSPFSGGVTVVIGEVKSPYATREPVTLEQK